MSAFYVTTPIYYVNDVPHLGTAYTTVAADAIKRMHALLGEETRMLTGTDEHGLKLERQAIERGQTPQAFVDEMSARFVEAWPKLGIESDDFIRTTEPRHEQWVQELWRTIEKNGDLYLGHYEDWYCVGCESFKTEKELVQPGNQCSVHLKPVERVKEETFFFRLSKYQDRLLAFYEKRPSFIEPTSRRNEVLSFVQSGLKDLSVSRTSFSWGIPVPGHERHVMYVWFDALANYRSALGSGDLTRFWAPSGKVLHLVGKDILRFHTVFWPAFLLAAGYTEEELPTQVFAHGFLTIDGQKMSKSLRNAVDPLRIAEELGEDVLRYYLLRAVAFGQDGDFSHEGIIERYNADLAKNLGNLLNRTLGLCAKLTGGVTPTMGERTALEDGLVAECEKAVLAAKAAWLDVAPHRALEITWQISDAANQYVDRAAPWTAAKNKDTARVETILATLLEVLRMLSVLVWPAMPKKANSMREQLGLAPIAISGAGNDQWPYRFESRAAGAKLSAGSPLFPTIDKDREREILGRLLPAPEPSKEANGPSLALAPGGAAAAEGISAAAPAPSSAPIGYEQFTAVDLRVGIVKTSERVPKKDKLLLLTVDVGEPEPRTIVAGLALSFPPETLVGRRVVVVANLAPREFGRGLVSHGMLLATGAPESLTLATVDDKAPAGARLK